MTMRLLPILAVALLAACKPAPEVLDGRAPDPMESQLANAPKAELPPAIKANVAMRCQPGNALVFVEFFDGDKLAMVGTEKNAPKTRLTAPEAGQPYTAQGGWTLTGNAKSATIEIPGKGKLTCKA